MMAESTMTEYRITAAAMPSGALEPLSTGAVTHVVERQSTGPQGTPWASPTRTLPGLRELRWFEANTEAMRQYEGRWVAIKGNHVESDGASFEEVHDDVSARGIERALIIFVRPGVPGVRDIA